MFPEPLETESLTIKQFCEDHVDIFELYDLFEADADGVEDVLEYVPQEPYQTPKEAAEDLAEAEADWEDREEAQYAVFADCNLAGHTGIVPEWKRQTGRIGLVLDSEYWGRGYAGECAMALTELAFERLDLELVSIGHETGNDRSARAIEKYIDSVGGRKDGVLRNWTPVGDDLLAHHRFSVTIEEYERAMDDS